MSKQCALPGAIKHLKDVGLLQENRVITQGKLSDFRDEVTRLTRLVKRDFDIDAGPIFTDEVKVIPRGNRQATTVVNRAIPNKPVFDAIDDIRDNGHDFEVKSIKLPVNFNQLATASESVLGQVQKSKKNPLPVDNQESVDFRDEIEMMLFQGKAENTDAKSILENIKNSGFITNSVVKELLDKLLLQTKAKVKIVKASELPNSDTYMSYNTGTNTISISLETLGNVNSIEQAAANFIHEVLHERTHRVLSSPKNDYQKQLVSDIGKIYNSLKGRLEELYPHEMSSIDEFVTGLFSNNEFAKEVRNRDRSFIQKFIDMIKSLLGLSTEYDTLLNNIMRITEESNEFENGVYKTLETKSQAEQEFDNSPFEEAEDVEMQNISNRIQDRLKKFYDMSLKYNAKLKTNSAFTETIEGILDKIDVSREKYEDFEEDLAKEVITKYILFASKQMKSLKIRLNKVKQNNDFDANFFNATNNYLSTFSLVNPISELLTSMHANGNISDKEYYKYKSYIGKVEGAFVNNKNTLLALAQKDLLNNDLLLNEIKDIEVKYRKRFESQANSIYNNKEKRKEYVANKMAENRDVIKNETRLLLRKKLFNTQDDILSISQMMNNEKSINNWIISTLSNTLDKVDSNITQELNPVLLRMQNLSKKFFDKHGKNANLEKVFKNILEQDSEGNYYLKGQYKIEFYSQYKKLMKEFNEVMTNPESTAKDMYLAKEKLNKFKKDNVILGAINPENGQSKKGIKSKWRANHNLSELDKEALELFKMIIEQSDKNTGKRSVLGKKVFGETFYHLPSVRKSTLERIVKGDLKAAAKERYLEGFTKQKDQEDEGEVSNEGVYEIYTDLDGKELHTLPIHFRNKIEPTDQSLDLFTIFSMEARNGIKYKNRKLVEPEMRMFLEVLKSKKYKKSSVLNQKYVSIFGNKQEVEQDAENSNILKMFETIMKTRLYDKTKESVGQIAGVDVNKFTGAIMNWTSTVGMALNYFSAPANFIIGNVNNVLAVIKDSNIDISNYTKAANFYKNDFAGLLSDVGRNVDKSLTNQILKVYNTFGDFSDLKSDFVKNTRGKSLLKSDTLQFMHGVGEHAIQGILTLTILDSIKITNSEGKYLDKTGNVVSYKSAASLLDVQQLDENGVLTTSIPIEYTDFESQLKWNKGGKGSIDSLIKSKMLAAQGNYTFNLKSEFQKRWYGAMLLMYKKHIENPGLDRFRGLGNAFSKNAKDNLKINQSTKEYDEGSYATLARFMLHKIVPTLKAHKFGAIHSLLTKEDFKKLDDFEKANINRALAEIGMINVFSALAGLLAGLAGDDDDAIWFSAYLLERASSDMAQYYNPSEAWRLLQNPFASMKQVQFTIDMLETVFTPWTLDDTYESGIYKGDLKAWRKVMRNIPILTRRDLTAKQAYNFLNKGD